MQRDTNPFKYSDDNKRFHTWNYHLRKKFGGKVFKVPLNAGFTCPNLDGTKGVGGCIYCSEKGSGDFAEAKELPLQAQFDIVRNKLHKKWEQARYIAYFQAFSNTYAPIEILRETFDSVLDFPDLVGISIATRADCITDEIADYLMELAEKTYLIIELGLQTIHSKTLEIINRGHSYDEFTDGYNRLKSRGINICVHIINGLPFEDKQMMIETAEKLAEWKPHSIKIHLLHLLEGTKITEMWRAGKFEVLSRDEYVEIVCEQLKILPPKTIIQRVTGDGMKDDLVAPLWSLQKFVVMNEIDKKFYIEDTYQGAEQSLRSMQST